jgi:hypothetical protein
MTKKRLFSSLAVAAMVTTLSMLTENQLTTGYEKDTDTYTDAADTFVKAK